MLRTRRGSSTNTPSTAPRAEQCSVGSEGPAPASPGGGNRETNFTISRLAGPRHPAKSKAIKDGLRVA
eukprot:10229473-Lingulodinium_polyedra.AAC.1